VDFRTHEGTVSLKKLAWATDLHLDAADKSRQQLFFDIIKSYDPDILLIGGDISNGSSSLLYLQQLAKVINKPLYFVLGNHDYYYESIDRMRNQAHELSKAHKNIQYLADNGIFKLSETTALIGHDGWADGLAGDFLNSTVMLNDYFLIEELKRLTQEERFLKIQELGKEAATYLGQVLADALMTYDKIVLLTHVPPFREACLYEGKVCDANWAPHFVGQMMGETLQKVMKENPDKRLLVLCGHSHQGNDMEILPNLRVMTGQSELGIPNVQGIILVN
jgi:Icc-related predicted phosphoesterase